MGNLSRVMRTATLGGIGLSALACGQPLATQDYPGEPLLVLRGEILSQGGPRGNASGALRVALHWVGSAQEQIVDRQIVTMGGLGQYTLTLYHPPSPQVLRALPEGLGRVALGRIFLYEDYDDDGRWDRRQEPVVGGALEHLIVYSPETVVHPILGRLIPRGYQVSYSPSCPSDEALATPRLGQALRATSPDEVPLRLDGLSQINLDLNCDGRIDDPCLRLIQELSQDRTLTVEQRDAIILSCESHDPQPSQQEPCSMLRIEHELARMNDDLERAEDLRRRYQLCLLTQDTRDSQDCPAFMVRDMLGECTCPAERGFAIDPQGMCAPCEPSGCPDP